MTTIDDLIANVTDEPHVYIHQWMLLDALMDEQDMTYPEAYRHVSHVVLAALNAQEIAEATRLVRRRGPLASAFLTRIREQYRGTHSLHPSVTIHAGNRLIWFEYQRGLAADPEVVVAVPHVGAGYVLQWANSQRYTTTTRRATRKGRRRKTT